MSPEAKPLPDAVHVLLVEDEILIRSALAEYLRTAKLHVIEASNADEAWAYLQTGTVDLMFSDIQMPGSMDGVELARRVAMAYPAIRVILTSGEALSGTSGGAFLLKPYRPARAVSLVLSMLGIEHNGEAHE
jgi:two-component system, response regulator PdtaR